jgi:hypothetical protein
MARKKNIRKRYQPLSKAAIYRIADFHMREEERKKEQKPLISFNYPSVGLPQPLANMTVMGLTRILKCGYLDNYKKMEKVLIYAKNSSKESDKRFEEDDSLYSIYVNAVNMGYFEKNQELPVNSYIGYIVVGDKIKEGYYRILDSFLFGKKYTSKPESLLKCEPRKTFFEYIRLEGNVIKVPLSDELWQQLENRGTDVTRHHSVFFYWKPLFNRIYSHQHGFGNENGLYDIVITNKGRMRRYSQNDGGAVTKEKHKGPRMKGSDIMVIHFDRITFEQDEKACAFEVLKTKEWYLDWNCVIFKNGYFIVYPPLDGSVSFTPANVPCPGVIESFNYLKGYLNDRVSPIRCSVTKMQLTITDGIKLEEAVVEFAAMSRQNSMTVGKSSRPSRIAPSQQTFQQALSKAQQMSVEEFKKYKSQYIDYLAKHQYDKYRIIPCVEKLAHTTGDMTEYAFIFSIQCEGDRVLVVHENVNPDRSTLLFVVEEDVYDKTTRAIYDFLQSAEINKRSGIRDGAIEMNGTGVVNYKSVNHNDLDSWQGTIEDYLSQAMNFVTARHTNNNASKEMKMGKNLLKAHFPSLSRLLKETQTAEGIKEAKPIFEKLNLPLNRKIRPSDILERVPKSNYYIDSEGVKKCVLPQRRKKYTVNSKGEKVDVKDRNGKPVYENILLPIKTWSLGILEKLLTVQIAE